MNAWLSFEMTGEFVTFTNNFPMDQKKDPIQLMFTMLVRHLEDSTYVENRRFIEWFEEMYNAKIDNRRKAIPGAS